MYYKRAMLFTRCVQLFTVVMPRVNASVSLCSCAEDIHCNFRRLYIRNASDCLTRCVLKTQHGRKHNRCMHTVTGPSEYRTGPHQLQTLRLAAEFAHLLMACDCKISSWDVRGRTRGRWNSYVIINTVTFLQNSQRDCTAS